MIDKINAELAEERKNKAYEREREFGKQSSQRFLANKDAFDKLVVRDEAISTDTMQLAAESNNALEHSRRMSIKSAVSARKAQKSRSRVYEQEDADVSAIACRKSDKTVSFKPDAKAKSTQGMLCGTLQGPDFFLKLLKSVVSQCR